MTAPTAPFEVASPKSSHRLLTGLVVILGGMILVMVFFSHRSLYQIYCSHQEQLRLDQENARLAEENARLARTIDRLQNDPAMIQDLIHRELNFVKKTEIIFQLPPGQSQHSASPSPPAGGPLAESPAEAGAPPEAGKHPWPRDYLVGAPKPSPQNTR
ncbi:MAG: FtsB family cell division protein [Desulfobaccales bacterium]